MDGLPVIYGETISRTGVLVIRCNGSYTLNHNGVVWSPVGSFEGADEYIIASSGRFSIKHDSKEIFYFNVLYNADFRLYVNNLRQIDSSGIVDTVSAAGRYAQTTFIDGVNKLSFTFDARNLSVSDILLLEWSSNQSDITVNSRATDYAYYEVVGFDKTKPFWFKVGNVMIAFCDPIG